MLAELLESEEYIIQKYLEDHDYILSASVGEISWTYNFVLPHVRLGNGFIPDFIVVNGQSDSYWIYMVDIKRPNAKRFNKNGSFCNELNQAMVQVRNYTYYGQQHTDELRDLLCKEILKKYGDRLDTYDKQSLESCQFFNKTRRFIVCGYIIIGRRNDLSQTSAWQTSSLKESGLSIVSYDRLVEAENRLLEMILNKIPFSMYETDDVLINEQYSYLMKNKSPLHEGNENTSISNGKEDKIDKLRWILNAISSDVLQQGKSIVVADANDDYRWFIETLSLMVKQVNLCGGCITLLENNMEQEAYLLARSQFNNMLWIRYLLEDKDGKHLNEFIAQPYISQIFTNKKLIESLNHLDDGIKNKLIAAFGKEPADAINESIRRYKNELDTLNVSDTKTMSVLKMAKNDPDLFDMYITLYNEGSKFEHSDISTTQMYRKSILPQYDDQHVFTIELNAHSEEMWEKVFGYSNICLFYAFDAIRKKLVGSERHLFGDVGNIKGAFDENALKSIDIAFYKLQKM